MDSRSWNAVNSPKAIQGDQNTLTDNSVNIGQSFNEKQERVAALDDVIAKLKASEVQSAESEKAQRSLANVRDEIVDAKEPDKSTVKKYLETAKNLMGTAALGYEVTEAARKLFEMFGMS